MTDSTAAFPQSAAESALQPLLDAYAKQKRSAQQLTAELVSVCTQQPAATWEALSLLDRYHRRGVLSTALFREIKSELNSVAFGSGRSALSAPGPEADRTSGFASIFRTGFRTGRAARTAVQPSNTAQHNVPRTAQMRTAVLQNDKTAQLDRTVGLQVADGTAHLPASPERTAHLQRSPDQAERIKTVYLDDATQTERLGANRPVDTAYYSNTELQGDRSKYESPAQDRTERISKPVEHTARIQTPPAEDSSSQTSNFLSDVFSDAPSGSDTPVDIPRDPTQRLHTQRDSTIRLGGEVSKTSQGPEPRTEWLDGKKEVDTEYYSSTELRQSHGSARPTGTIVQDLQPERTLTRGQREHAAYVESAYGTQAESEQAAMEREALTQAAMTLSPSLRPGTVLMDRYVLVEPISNGGIGVVFKALDRRREALPESQRYVAVKCLHESLRNEPRAIAALQHEYRQSQALSHPNIAKVYDFHQADGVSFLSLELVDGESLSGLCERITPRRLPPSRALTIVREIGNAIAHAHENGILHGNLHPNNVIVTRAGYVRVREFGQATAWSDNAAASEAVRDMPPSPPEERYRSPQQKNAIPANASDDIYSLACIAFELLCGRAPDASVLKAGTRKPSYARHLNQQRWHALQIGLAEDRTLRGNDVRHWLAALDLSSAAIRLPSLSDLETELFGGEQSLFGRPWLWAGAASALAIALVGVWFWIGAKNAEPSATADTNTHQSAAQSAATPTVVDTASVEAQSSLPTAGGSVTQIAPTAPETSTPSVNPTAASTNTLPTTGFPTVGFAQARYEVPSNAPVAKLTLHRGGDSNKRLAVQWFSIEGSAKSDVDYVRDGNTTIVFQPGQRSAEIVVPLISTGPRDRALWFDVRIRATTEAMPGNDVVASVYLMPTLSQTVSP